MAQQQKLLIAVIKLLWRITKQDEEDPDIKVALMAKLAGAPKQGDAGEASSLETVGKHSSEGSLVWPALTLGFWQKVESLLNDESGYCAASDDAFGSWFASVLDSRPRVALA